MQQVKVWINQAPDRFSRGYQQGDSLMPALEFEASVDDSDEQILEATFVALNINPNPPTFGTLALHSILQYHLHFPSLSVGDVVDIEGARYACEPMGWKQIWSRRGFEKISEGVYFGTCEICRNQHYLHLYGEHGVCSDCMQGDPTEDLGLLHKTGEI